MKLVSIQTIILAHLWMVLGVVSWWMVYPYEPFEEIESVVRQPVIPIGGTLVIDRHYCVNTDVPSSASRELLRTDDGNGKFVYATGTQHFTPKGCWKRPFNVPIPDYVPAGHYEYHVTLTYRVNPIREIVVHLNPVPFMVESR